MLVAKIPSRFANEAIRALLNGEIVDRDTKIQRENDSVLVPIIASNLPNSLIRRFEIELEDRVMRHRNTRADPIIEIRAALQERGFDNELIDRTPDKWELLGDILILRMDTRILNHVKSIAETYADVLDAKAVLLDEGNIRGHERMPTMRIIYGEDTETVHKENGIFYALDAAKIMFSSGNIDERIRMASIQCENETILDMFAGIGYFSLPMAVHGEPAKIFACEIRRLSFEYLSQNIRLNKAERIIEPLLGDNCDFDPPEKVDRVIMGYLKETHRFLPKALSCLKSGGIVHYHENCPNERIPDRAIDRMRNTAGENWDLDILSIRVAKSYSPGVSHLVIDGRFTSS